MTCRYFDKDDRLDWGGQRPGWCPELQLRSIKLALSIWYFLAAQQVLMSVVCLSVHTVNMELSSSGSGSRVSYWLTTGQVFYKRQKMIYGDHACTNWVSFPNLHGFYLLFNLMFRIKHSIVEHRPSGHNLASFWSSFVFNIGLPDKV